MTLRRVTWSLLVILAVAALVSGLLLYRRPAEPPADSVKVPLGVEQAAIVTWSGPPLAVAPYKWGVAVNVRIASVTERAGAHIYDVRYLVNRGGSFDLKEYLVAADGSTLDGLPSFRFEGDPKLSKELEARIRETEAVRIHVGGHYFATLAMLGALWIVWLLLLIFYQRPRRGVAAAAAPPEPSLAELLRTTLAQLRSGALDATGKARLEMLVLRRWREELALGGQPMSTALAAMEREEKTGLALRQMEHWLHHRASPVQREELAKALAPFAGAPALPTQP